MIQVPQVGDRVPIHGYRLMCKIGQFILWVTGWRFEGGLPNQSRMVLLAAPHTSNWDAFYGFAALLAMGIKVCWMAKHTLFKWPFGRIFTAFGGIPINRTASHGVVEQMIAEFRQRPHLLLVVTPEGTRSRVEKWKTGFYHIAMQGKVPIVLGFIDYSRKRLGFGPNLEPTGDIIADFGELQNFYGKVTGKYPGNFNASIR